MNEEWGKGIWDISNYESDKGLVGPLKIIRLPSGRTPAKTIQGGVRSNYYASAIQSVIGSVAQSPSASINLENKDNINLAQYISFTKKINSPMVPNIDNENLMTLSNGAGFKKNKKITIGEENLKKLMNQTRTTRNSRKIKLP